MSTVQLATPGAVISADSHVVEAADFMERRLPAGLKSRAPRFPEERIGENHQAHPGGRDPSKRLEEMTADGVNAEVLYPSYPMSLYSMEREDADLQAACFRAYNDWIIEYCAVAPERLIGIGTVSTYDIDDAIKELHRCKENGLRGVMIWLCPPPDLPFHSSYYDPFWAEAEKLGVPVNLHTSTGQGEAHRKFPGRSIDRTGIERYRSGNYSQLDMSNSLFDIIFSGVFERFPRLKLVLVETDIGWIPFRLQKWDQAVAKHSGSTSLSISRLPSEYFNRHMWATFINDWIGAKMLSWWGQDNCMWSNDYPHPASSWPHSRQIIASTLGHLTPEVRDNVVRGNVARLYNMA